MNFKENVVKRVAYRHWKNIFSKFLLECVNLILFIFAFITLSIVLIGDNCSNVDIYFFYKPSCVIFQLYDDIIIVSTFYSS